MTTKKKTEKVKDMLVPHYFCIFTWSSLIFTKIIKLTLFLHLHMVLNTILSFNP